jgi:hypothetical protein
VSVGRLYEQYRTERSFNWYSKNAEWREANRRLYPMEWVSAYHTGRARSDQELRDHGMRFRAFQVEFMEPRIANRNLKQQGC